MTDEINFNIPITLRITEDGAMFDYDPNCVDFSTVKDDEIADFILSLLVGLKVAHSTGLLANLGRCGVVTMASGVDIIDFVDALNMHNWPETEAAVGKVMAELIANKEAQEEEA